MKYYLGVDGGGTKTEFVLLNKSKQLVSRTFKDKSNPNDIGVPALITLLKDAILDICPKDTTELYVSMGLSGLVYSGATDTVIAGIKAIEFVKEAYIDSDRKIAIDAAYGNNDGAIAILGTGNAIYVRKNNEYFAFSGAGFLYDETLSGFDLGRLAVKRVIEDIEGRGKHTVLTKLILEQCGSIENVVKTTYVEGKKFVAGFSKLVTENYETDEVCKDIIALLCDNFYNYLKRTKDYVDSITFVGGLAQLWNPIFSKFVANPPLNIEILTIPPVCGAFVRFGFDQNEVAKALK